MKKLIVTDPVRICGLDLIGSDIQNFGWEARMYGIWQDPYLSDPSSMFFCNVRILHIFGSLPIWSIIHMFCNVHILHIFGSLPIWSIIHMFCNVHILHIFGSLPMWSTIHFHFRLIHVLCIVRVFAYFRISTYPMHHLHFLHHPHFSCFRISSDSHIPIRSTILFVISDSSAFFTFLDLFR